MTLYPFQEAGVRWLCALKRGGILADDMGMGKTLQVLHAAHRLGVQRVLVVTRNACRPVWAQELDKWFPDTRYRVIDAPTMKRAERIAAVTDRAARFVVVNYDMMRALIDHLAKQRWDIVVFDEAHALANRKSLTHRASRFLTRSSIAQRVWHLTGTPVQNHVQEYWPLLRVFDTQFGSYWRFVHAHCVVEDVVHPRTKMVLGKQVSNITNERDPRVQALVQRVAPYVLRRTKHDYYDQLPGKTYTRIPLVMDQTHRRLYTAMNGTMRCVLPNGVEITADTLLAQQTRLLQLCVDWRTALGDVAHDETLTGPKADALLTHIDALDGRPFVVFSQWSRAISMVGNLLADNGITHAEFTGRNLVTREDQLRAWNASERQALLVTIEAGGVGRDFTHADTAFFIDRSWNPKANLQAEDRLWRHGQKNAVNIYDFYYRHTIEEHVLHVDDVKTHVADITVEALAE